MSITLCTLNTKGLVNKNKRRQIFKYIEDKKYDIIFLQETHTDKLSCETWKNEWEGDAYFSGTKSNKEGVGFLINKLSNIICSNFHELVIGRLITLNIQINNKDITLVNIYGPNNDNINIFNILETFVSENTEQNIIISGDFNTVLNPLIDKRNGRCDTNKQEPVGTG